MTIQMIKENNVLLGYSGLVGSYILRYVKIENMYNSKNINDVRNMEVDNLYIACIPAVKWYANKYPEKDSDVINGIQDIIKTIKVKNKVILISTIDVYNKTNSGMDEETLYTQYPHHDPQNNHPYGKHRYMFEEFIKAHFKNYYIIRLPALFGIGLKKNILYDLLNNNNVNQICKNTYFQWYNLEWLVNDIEICIENNIRVCNLFTQPINTNDILTLFPEYNYDNNPVSTSSILNYNIKTRNYKYFDSNTQSITDVNIDILKDINNGYIYNKLSILDEIKKFVNISRINNGIDNNVDKLCISNITNNGISWKQFYEIMKLKKIFNIELALTKYYTWQELFDYPEYINNIKNDIAAANINIYSLQSITYGILGSIFDNIETYDKIKNHIFRVIDIATILGVKNLVFGCPKNRKIPLLSLFSNSNNLSSLNNKYDVIFKKFMVELGEYIGSREIIISIENNSKKYDCNYLNTLDEVVKIVKFIGHSKIKMMVDIGNCIMENESINEINNLIAENINIINHIHISMPFLTPLHSVLDTTLKTINIFIQHLSKIKYDKYFSLEFINNNNNDKIIENELKILNLSIDNYNSLFNLLNVLN